MHTVMLLNPKGGSGKTTIATNLAAYFASRHLPTALFDHDAQGSSTCWLASRPPTQPSIYGVAAFRNLAGVTRSWQLRVPLDTQRVVVDTPAGLPHPYLANLVRRADSIIVPVLSSPIDINAVHSFVEQLHRVEPACKRGVRICAVLNRVRNHGRSLHEPEAALRGLGLSVVTRLREAPCYTRAAACGRGVHELRRRTVGRRLEDWDPLLSWLEAGAAARSGRGDTASWPTGLADAPLPA